MSQLLNETSHCASQSYFSHEGYLSGVTLSQSRTALLPEFRRVLRFYGYDVDAAAEGPEGSNATLASPQVRHALPNHWPWRSSARKRKRLIE